MWGLAYKVDPGSIQKAVLDHFGTQATKWAQEVSKSIVLWHWHHVLLPRHNFCWRVTLATWHVIGRVIRALHRLGCVKFLGSGPRSQDLGVRS